MKAITGATLIDGTGSPPVTEATVVVDGDSIVAAGPDGSVRLPPEADVIEGSGLTLLPGLIDCHDHLANFTYDPASRWGLTEARSTRHARIASVLKQTLETGYTAVRDAAELDAGFKQAVDEGLIPGPRLQVAVNFITPTGGLADRTTPSGLTPPLGPLYGIPVGVADGPVAMRAKVREMIRAGAGVIKTATNGWGKPQPGLGHKDQIMTREELEALVDESHTLGKLVMCHTFAGPALRMAVEAGVNSIEHGSYLDGEPDLLPMMADKNIFFVPTFSVFVHHSEKGRPHDKAAASDMRDHHVKSLHMALEAGVKVVAGTDEGGWVHGNNAHELTCLVNAGMTPMQALVAATGHAAECLGMDDEIGTVAAGKKADLVLVDGDPLTDISILEEGRSVVWVMKDGEVCLDRTSARSR